MLTDEVLRLMQEVAEQVINPRFQTLVQGQVHEKNPGDLVTVADHEAESLITEALLHAWPDAVVLGEEAAADDPGLLSRYAAASHAFTVDPVDGTKNFVHGSPDHAVMVSEVREGVVERAWIWQPQHQTSYVAERGAGCRRNGEPLERTPPLEDPALWRGVTSRRPWIGRRLPGLRPLELTWVCCGVDYPQLIEGGADFILYSGSKPWDHAPGSLLLSESGGQLSDFGGLPYDPRRQGSPLLAAADPRTAATVRNLLIEL